MKTPPIQTRRSQRDGTAEAEKRIAESIREKAIFLDLSHLGLETVPESLREVKGLKRLKLSSNKLATIPAWIGELSHLVQLDLYLNPLQEIPQSLGRLTALEILRIDSASETAADKIIGTLGNLRELAIARLGLRTVPEWVRNLKKLSTLYLFENELTQLPEWLGELTKLSHLNLSENHLSALPAFLKDLSSLKRLDVSNNEELRLPAEITKSSDAIKILSYYFRTAGQGASQPLNEFKLILVGRGGVGKTTLVHRIVTNQYKAFKRTPGIKITKWPSKIDGNDVRAHVWDFGGQEIMHGTHRFFMTERALYLVLISGREGTEDRDAEYWLSLVKSFAGEVPVIVLLHKWDDYRFELNRGLLREKFGGNLAFLETDSSTAFGISRLREHICELAKNLPGLKAAWPTEWRRIKEELPSQKRSWLTFNDFRHFCTDNGVIESDAQEALADSLHDLGLMLSYRKEETLRDFGILNPQWVTKGIYEILNSRELRDAGGKFTVKAFDGILPAKKYPRQLHPYLLALMRKFKLCHPLDDRGEKHLIPELLTKEEPNLEAEFPPKECLGFIYRYDAVLPEGLLPRFVVETYVHREPKHVWRTGVVLERANCRALVRGDVQGRAITIRIAGVGNGRRELLGIIREHFERIHRSYESLPVTELVPLPGFPSAHVKHELLLKYEQSQRETIAVEVGDELMDCSVGELLDGVDLPGALRGRGIQSGDLFDGGAVERRRQLSLFISYSHKDETFRDELRGALTAYERRGDLITWDDTCIIPGKKWEPEILQKLERASIVVLLLSNDFIRSDYCMQKEMVRALERDQAGECAIVPIVVRACAFTKLELGKLQAILPKGRPVRQHKDRDSAWLKVTNEIDRVITSISAA